MEHLFLSIVITIHVWQKRKEAQRGSVTSKLVNGEARTTARFFCFHHTTLHWFLFLSLRISTIPLTLASIYSLCKISWHQWRERLDWTQPQVIRKSLHRLMPLHPVDWGPCDQVHFSLLAKNSRWKTWRSMWGLIWNPKGNVDKEPRTRISHTELEHAHSEWKNGFQSQEIQHILQRQLQNSNLNCSHSI